MPKLCPKLILEGTRLTHKTDLAFALNEHPRVVGPRKYRYHSPVVSGEWCGLTNTPWGEGLINFSPPLQAQAIETYRTWVRLFGLLRYYSWIVDRFHLSTRAFQEAHGQGLGPALDRALDETDQQLAALGFRLILCTRRPDSFAAARTERLKVSGKPDQYDDLSVFVDEQEQLRALARASRLETLELDVSDGDVAAAADRIADWLEDTGGLHAVDPSEPRA